MTELIKTFKATSHLLSPERGAAIYPAQAVH